MKPDRRAELRRLEDASFRTTASHDNEVLKERIKALESLLAEAGIKFLSLKYTFKTITYDKLISKIDAILPKTEELK